jgi:hypothetical protein
MTSDAEKGYKDHAPRLLQELRQRTRKLKENDLVVDPIISSIDEAEDLFNNKKFPESEEKYHEAKSKVETVEISHRAKPLALKLFRIELCYLLLLLLVAYLTNKWPQYTLWRELMTGPIAMHLQTVWFGALGGISIAIYGIYEHVYKRDFDPAYELWYISKPIIGGIFGWFVYLIYYLGLVSVQGYKGDIQTPELPYLIAFLAGFSERFTLKMIDKLMAVLTTWDQKTSGTTNKPSSEQ